MRILGLDPGLADTGWGMILVQGSVIRHLGHGTIHTLAKLPTEQRLHLIHTELAQVIQTWAPQSAAIEALFFTKNVSSALPVAHARGVIMLSCAMAGIPVGEYTPPQIKQAVVGTGRAEKAQVQEMVRLILGLSQIPKPDHAADALAAAICHSHFAAFGAALTGKPIDA
jgi:crossover junction endodeoxyribonuclease RuvC